MDQAAAAAHDVRPLIADRGHAAHSVAGDRDLDLLRSSLGGDILAAVDRRCRRYRANNRGDPARWFRTDHNPTIAARGTADRPRIHPAPRRPPAAAAAAAAQRHADRGPADSGDAWPGRPAMAYRPAR